MFQFLGGTLFASAAQSAFVNTLIQSLASLANGFDATSIIQTGATEVRKTVPAALIPEFLDGYVEGIQRAFAIGLAGCVLSFIVSLLIVGLPLARKQWRPVVFH